MKPAERRIVPGSWDFVLFGEVDIDRQGWREVDLIRVEMRAGSERPSDPAWKPPPSRPRFVATTVGRILADLVYYEKIEFFARIDSWIDGNAHVASDGSRRICLDGESA